MKKSVSQSNTILNYFGRTPSKTPLKTPSKEASSPLVTASPSVKSSTPLKRKENTLFDKDDSDNDAVNCGDVSQNKSKKRFKRLLIESSEEENKKDDEYKPSEESDSSDMYVDESKEVDDDDDGDEDFYDEEEEDETPKKKPTKAKTVSVSKRKNNNISNISRSASKSFSQSMSKSTNGNHNNSISQSVTCSYIQAIDREWPHMSYPFLQPDKMCDGKGRKYYIDGELNPECDQNTLYVPKEFLDQQTPAMRQWWVIKSTNFATVLFFKMGKFYEVFHMDAVICTKEAQIQFMKGNYAHAGFPEKSYKRYADVLIQKGYSVARIEQTETPDMMQQRTKKTKSGKFDKVVTREVCRISSIGTRFTSDIDSDALNFSNSYLYALSYKVTTTLTALAVHKFNNSSSLFRHTLMAATSLASPLLMSLSARFFSLNSKTTITTPSCEPYLLTTCRRRFSFQAWLNLANFLS